MKKSLPVLCVLALLLTSYLAGTPARAAAPVTKAAVAASWSARDLDSAPAGGAAVVNINDGILGASPEAMTAYHDAATRARSRGVVLYGYVPTGYGDRDWHPTDQIDRQMSTWREKFGDLLDGLFFDQVGSTCDQVKSDVATASKRARGLGFRSSVFDTTWVGNNWCYVSAIPAGDQVVAFDGTADEYAGQPWLDADLGTARSRAAADVKVWTIIRGARDRAAAQRSVDLLKQRKPDFAYVTDAATRVGEPSRVPGLWPQLVACAQGGTCDMAPQDPDAALRARTGMPVMSSVSYWKPSEFRSLPDNSIAFLNIGTGILGEPQSWIDTYKPEVQAAAARGVRFWAYVPTGYDVREQGKPNGHGPSVGQSLATIRSQVDRYVAEFGAGNLNGIFYDEANPTCEGSIDNATGDFAQMSGFAHAHGLRAVFNPGWVGNNQCYVKATPAGDVVVTFENSLDEYLTNQWAERDLAEGQKLAASRGASTVHLLHTTAEDRMSQAYDKLRQRHPDYAYLSPYGGRWYPPYNETTWAKPSDGYYAKETACFSKGECRS